MAWVGHLDGNNDQWVVPATDIGIGETLKFRGRATGDTVYRIIGATSGYSTLLELGATNVNVRFGSAANNFVSSGYVRPELNAFFELELERLDVGNYQVRLDGGVLGNIATPNSFIFTAIGGLNSAIFFQGDVEYVTLTGRHNWNADASNHGAGNPDLIDSIGGVTAIAQGMPTDGSVWENLNPGGTLLTANYYNKLMAGN